MALSPARAAGSIDSIAWPLGLGSVLTPKDIAQEMYLEALKPSDVRMGLDRVAEALEALGNPQDKVPAVHVAGTNGKGSTCAFIDALVRAHGKRVGFYSSPHLERVNERFRLDGVPLSDQQLAEVIRETRIRLAGHRLTYFEFATLVAFQSFANLGLDLAVVETGLGGRLDATTACRPGRERGDAHRQRPHEIPGGNFGLHCREKAAIIRDGVPAVVSEQEQVAWWGPF